MQSKKIVDYLTKRYDKKTLTPKEAGFEMGVSAYRAREMRKSKEITSLKIEDVAMWISQQD